jgi:hypothetical protein
MDFPYGVTLTVRSVTTTTDDLGDSTETTSDAAWGPCAVASRYANEGTGDDQPRVVVGKTVYGPRRSFDSDDLVIIDGVAWQVDGLPDDSTVNPFTGWDPGIVVQLKRAAAV